MNTPSPLVPQGTMPDRGKSHIRIAVFTILAIHVVLLSALLIAGCKKTTTDTAQQDQTAPPPVMPPPDLPPAVTNPAAGAPGNQFVGGTPLPPPETNIITPPPPPPPQNDIVVPPAAGMSEHTIIKGETFGVLARKYGVTTKAIEAANPGVNSTRLKIGQKIKIPPPKPAANGAVANGVAREAGEKIYTVRSGDNLLKIAKAHGVTAKQIRSHNGLRTDQIRVGQKLKIPVKSPVPPPVEATIPPPVTEPPPPIQ